MRRAYDDYADRPEKRYCKAEILVFALLLILYTVIGVQIWRALP